MEYDVLCWKINLSQTRLLEFEKPCNHLSKHLLDVLGIASPHLGVLQAQKVELEHFTMLPVQLKQTTRKKRTKTNKPQTANKQQTSKKTNKFVFQAWKVKPEHLAMPPVQQGTVILEKYFFRLWSYVFLYVKLNFKVGLFS